MRVHKLSGMVIRVAVILLCLVLFSSHLASGMFARYAVNETEDGNAHAAKYGVKVIAADNAVPIDDQGNVSYRFKVDNSGSDISVRCSSILVSFMKPDETSNPAPVTETVAPTEVAPDDTVFGEVTLDGYAANRIEDKGDTVEYTFDIDNQIEAGGTSGMYTLSFTATKGLWTETTDTSLADNTIKIERDKYPVNIFVSSEQIN